MTEDAAAEKAASSGPTRISRRAFVGGVAVGAAGAWGLSYGLARFGDDPARPPDLYEYFLDNFWFKTADLEHQEMNAPLKGNHKADIVIIGGGFTGLSSAYNLRRTFPNKKIVLLEGACCGYGASGRNGGFAGAGISGLMNYVDEVGPELGRKAYDASTYGLKQIRELVSEQGIECDFEENGMLEAAMNEGQAEDLQKQYETYKAMGMEATIVHGKELEAEIKSPRYIAGLKFPYGAILNPAKLARETKRVVEEAGVEIRERTVVMRVTPGKTHRIETEMGEITAPVLVLGLNGYACKLGFFRNRMVPLCSYVIATEPLSEAQWESVGWQNRQGLSDQRVLFNYQRPTADGRIVIGGSAYPYYANDALSSEFREQQAGHRTPGEGSVHDLSPVGGPSHRTRVGRNHGIHHRFHSVGGGDGRAQEHLLRRRLQRSRRRVGTDRRPHHLRAYGGRKERAYRPVCCESQDSVRRPEQSAISD
jgi:glycine/D-amino acid oxidase-like deaminating enzyme